MFLFWFSYILFLIFLGGMLVFYVTSLSSNEMFSMSMKLTIMCVMIISILILMNLFDDETYMSFLMENNKMQYINNMNMFIKEYSFSLNKLYNYPTHMITILLMNYLLITLIAVVKITKLFYGPFRLLI